MVSRKPDAVQVHALARTPLYQALVRHPLYPVPKPIARQDFLDRLEAGIGHDLGSGSKAGEHGYLSRLSARVVLRDHLAEHLRRGHAVDVRPGLGVEAAEDLQPLLVASQPQKDARLDLAEVHGHELAPFVGDETLADQRADLLGCPVVVSHGSTGVPLTGRGRLWICIPREFQRQVWAAA